MLQFRETEAFDRPTCQHFQLGDSSLDSIKIPTAHTQIVNRVTAIATSTSTSKPICIESLPLD